MLKIKNWSSFQSFKDRSPPWIRLHKRLIDNFDFQRMSVNSRAILPMLWLIASEHKDPTSGKIELSFDALAFRLRLSTDEIKSAVLECSKNNFIEIIEYNQEVTDPLHNYYNSDTEKLLNCHSEAEAEYRGRVQRQSTEADKKSSTSEAEVSDLSCSVKKTTSELGKSEFAKMVLGKWQELGSAVVQPRVISPAVIAAINARRRDNPVHESAEYWDWFISQIRESKFLSGRTAPSPGRQQFRLSVEWAFNATNFSKIVNGNYADPITPPAKSENWNARAS